MSSIRDMRRYYLLIIVLSFLPIASLLITPDMPHTHDGPVHLARLAAYYKELLGGQILPRWAGDLNYGYGMPLFNFIYHTPYLISSLFLTMGFGLVASFKFTLALSFLGSGLSMLLFTHALFKDKTKALVLTIFYQFAPFRFVDMIVRGSIGEVYTFTFLPLVLYALTKATRQSKIIWTLLGTFATALLIISHNSISMMFFGVSVLFVLVTTRGRKSLVRGLLPLILGLMLASFFWFPALVEHKYTYGDLFMKNLYREHFPPVWSLVAPNFTNSSALQTGGVSVQIGIFHVLALLTAVYALVNKKLMPLEKRILSLSVTLTAGSIFFMQPISQVIWSTVSFLRQFQFPWRLLTIIVLSSSFASLSFFLLPNIKKLVFLFAICVLTIVTSAYYWYPPLGFDPVPDETPFWSYPLNTTYYGETDVVWSGGPATSYPKDRVAIAGGNGTIQDFSRTTTQQSFRIYTETDTEIISHTQYFPGWRVYVDEEKIPIQFQNPAWRGLITFMVPAGKHTVKIAFEKSGIQRTGEFMSLGALIVLVFLYALRKRIQTIL